MKPVGKLREKPLAPGDLVAIHIMNGNEHRFVLGEVMAIHDDRLLVKYQLCWAGEWLSRNMVARMKRRTRPSQP